VLLTFCFILLGPPQEYSKNQSWWPRGLDIKINIVSADNDFMATAGALDVITTNAAAGTPIVGLMGPLTSEASMGVR
jgi:hypothetical protein